MQANPSTVLLIEDSPVQAKIVRKQFDAFSDFPVLIAHDLQEAEACLNEHGQEIFIAGPRATRSGSRIFRASPRQRTAGTIDHRKMSFSDIPSPSNTAATTGPVTAPALSSARCRPNARPRKSAEPGSRS